MPDIATINRITKALRTATPPYEQLVALRDLVNNVFPTIDLLQLKSSGLVSDLFNLARLPAAPFDVSEAIDVF